MSFLPKQVLIVEDDKLLLKILKDNLEKGGFKVLTARTGEDGLKEAFSSHPDLILLDILLVEMDGIGFLSELRKDDWGKDVPVIILSNLSDGVIINKAIEKGVRPDDYLKKAEWDLKGVVEKVKNRLAG